MKKRNDESDNIQDWTTKKLKDEAKSYHQTIYEVGCYGTSDIRIYEALLNELSERGIEFSMRTTLNF
jgi:hypothetical protein